MVMEHMVVDGAVENSHADETKVAVDGRSAAAKECPGFVVVVGEGGVGVLEEGYGYYVY